MSFYRLARLEMYVKEKHLNFHKKKLFLKFGNFPTIYRAVFSTNFDKKSTNFDGFANFVICGLNKPKKQK